MDNKIKVALIGCGAISRTHIDSLKEIKMCEIKTVCDTDEKRATKAAKELGCEQTADYMEALSDPNIDAVHILTPHYLHAPMAIEALNAGKHVVLEKPVGISAKDIKKLMQAENECSSKIGVVFQNRYNNTSIAMKSIIDDGELGSFKAAKGIVAWNRDMEYYNSSPWRGKWDTEGGGLLINQAIHTVDLIRWFGGNISSLQGHIANNVLGEIEVEDTAMATFYFENGAIGNFYGTNNHGINSKIELEFIFENGVLRLLEDKLYLQKEDTIKIIAEDIVDSGKKAYWGLSHTACIKAFYESVKNEKTPEITVADAAKSNEIVLGIYESSKINDKYFLTEE